ncbi:MAG: hypothetical protein GIX02_05960, partial [Candidatus Eremiobacteraeota bacterium]|nr:hypothetical protein [Candidatus Eremiobacteraeota bacterium]
MKIIAGINAFVIAASASAALADPGALPQRSDALAAHRVGQILDYSLQGNMAQSIDGKDAFGRAIHQNAMPTTINGRERIAFKRLSASSMFISRSGSLTATVAGKSRPIRGVGHTVVDPSGTITRDRGTIGGVFLLPLAFLGQRSMHAGADLVVGDSWSGQLGTKLFGMTARPRLRYTVTGRRSVLGVQVFT